MVKAKFEAAVTEAELSAVIIRQFSLLPTSLYHSYTSVNFDSRFSYRCLCLLSETEEYL